LVPKGGGFGGKENIVSIGGKRGLKMKKEFLHHLEAPSQLNFMGQGKVPDGCRKKKR